MKWGFREHKIIFTGHQPVIPALFYFDFIHSLKWDSTNLSENSIGHYQICIKKEIKRTQNFLEGYLSVPQSSRNTPESIRRIDRQNCFIKVHHKGKS